MLRGSDINTYQYFEGKKYRASYSTDRANAPIYTIVMCGYIWTFHASWRWWRIGLFYPDVKYSNAVLQIKDFLQYG